MRFLNADPSGFSGGPNWFAYADGNPISLSDPFGLCAENNSSLPSLNLQRGPFYGEGEAGLSDASVDLFNVASILGLIKSGFQLGAATLRSGLAGYAEGYAGKAIVDAAANSGTRAAVTIGEDLSSAAGTTVWRNVPSGHGALADAQAGIVRPYGSTINEALDVRALGHDIGSTQGSGLTSWMADQAWALSRQNRLGGVVLETTAPNGSVWFNQAAKGAESQVLIPGTIRTR